MSPDETIDIDQARRGCREAFHRLVVRYHARVYQFLLRRTSSAPDAEDATQETFLRAWTAIARFDPARSAAFTTWLLTLAERSAASLARSRAAERRAIEKSDRRALTPPARTEAEGPFGLWADVDRHLRPDARSMLWLRYAEDLTPSQIALVLERSEISVRVTLFRARRTLARVIERPSDEVVLRCDSPRLALDSGTPNLPGDRS